MRERVAQHGCEQQHDTEQQRDFQHDNRQHDPEVWVEEPRRDLGGVVTRFLDVVDHILDPENADVAGNLGMAYAMTGKMPAAIKAVISLVR